MATGKRLIKNADNGGWATYKVRRWGERDYQSDRMKLIRKVISKKCRRILEKEEYKLINESIYETEM